MLATIAVMMFSTSLFAFGMGMDFNIGDIFTISVTGDRRGQVCRRLCQQRWGYGGDGAVTVGFIFRFAGDKYER